MPRANLFPPTHGGYILDLSIHVIGQAVSEKLYEHCERTTMTLAAGAWVY